MLSLCSAYNCDTFSDNSSDPSSLILSFGIVNESYSKPLSTSSLTACSWSAVYCLTWWAAYQALFLGRSLAKMVCAWGDSASKVSQIWTSESVNRLLNPPSSTDFKTILRLRQDLSSCGYSACDSVTAVVKSSAISTDTESNTFALLYRFSFCSAWRASRTSLGIHVNCVSWNIDFDGLLSRRMLFCNVNWT